MTAQASPDRTDSPGPAIHVIQGQFHISERPEDVLVTILGSCVATCLCDPVRGIGGMNHFLLPKGGAGEAGNIKYGVHAMELLINSLLSRGGRRDRLEAKVFGGANMMQGLPQIGSANARFALWFLENEGIRCVARSLDGSQARKVRYWPASGRAQVMLLDKLPRDLARKPPKRPPAGEITLF